MKTKIAIITAALTLMAGGTAPAVASPAEQCWTAAGCFRISGNEWYCPNPDAYSACAPE